MSIGGYQLVKVEKINKNVRQYTYRARLKNRGAAVGGARAVLIRKHGDFQMIDGELNFGPVRPHASRAQPRYVLVPPSRSRGSARTTASICAGRSRR